MSVSCCGRTHTHRGHINLIARVRVRAGGWFVLRDKHAHGVHIATSGRRILCENKGLVSRTDCTHKDTAINYSPVARAVATLTAECSLHLMVGTRTRPFVDLFSNAHLRPAINCRFIVLLFCSCLPQHNHNKSTDVFHMLYNNCCFLLRTVCPPPLTATPFGA